MGRERSFEYNFDVFMEVQNGKGTDEARFAAKQNDFNISHKN
jgi:hypothetical protein